MPTFTTKIAAGANDGKGSYNTAGTTNNLDSTSNFINFGVPTIGSITEGAWLRFTGVTIPEGATIDGATLSLYAARAGGGSISLRMDAAATPGNPASGKAVVSPTSVVDAGGTIGTKTTVVPQLVGYAPTTRTDLTQLDVTLTAFIAALLAANGGYDNGEMVVYAGNIASAGNRAFIYAKDWDAGSATRVPLLSVEYTPATRLPDKTPYRFS